MDRYAAPLRFVACLAVLALLGSTATQAANCGANTRKIRNQSGGSGAKTSLVNHTDVVVTGIVYRNGNLKEKKELKKGMDMSQVATTGESGEPSAEMKGTFHIFVEGADAPITASCTYTFGFRTNSNELAFSDITKVECEDASAICKGCTIACDRGWDENKSHWNIRLHLNPPGSSS